MEQHVLYGLVIYVCACSDYAIVVVVRVCVHLHLCRMLRISAVYADARHHFV